MTPTKFVKYANPEQQWFVERGPAPTLLAGGINSGKTVGGVLKMISLLMTYPGSRGAIIRRAYTQLTKTTMETLFQWVTPEFYRPHGSFNSQTGVLDFNNGSRLYFIHLDAPGSLDVLAGLEINFGYVSQAEEISEKAWDLLDVRVGRWTGATVPQEILDAYPGGAAAWPWKSQDGSVLIPPRYIFAESYVTDETHWLYRRFVDSSPEREQWKKLGYEHKVVNSDSNVFAIKATLDAAKAKDEDYQRRYVTPVWGNPEGQIFHVDPMSELDFSPALIDRIKRTMTLHRSMDHGDTAPTVVLWHATDHDGNIFVYREYYMPNALVSEHRRAIYNLSKDDRRYHSEFADPSIFAKSRGRTATKGPEWSVADEWRDSRLLPSIDAITWRAASNDQDATMSRLKEYLRVDPDHRHPITGELGAPRLYFIKKSREYQNGCDYVIKETKAQRRVKVKVGDREVWTDDRDDTVVDHAYDALVYFVVSRPSLGPTPPPVAAEKGHIPIAAYREADRRDRVRNRREARLRTPGGQGWGG